MKSPRHPLTLTFIICMLVAYAIPLRAQENVERVSLPGTEIRSLKSTHTGEQYNIYVHPVGNAGPDAHYPVVFILDAQWDFPMITGIYGGLNYDEFVPNVILVGITYSGDNPDYGSLRAMDMTPTSMANVPGSGRAPQFLSFIKDELIPFVEAEYNADPTGRTLMGSSYGGLFTVYALLHEPDLFARYVAPSSAFHWDNGVIFKYEEALAQKRSDLPIKLYMTAGEQEGAGMIDPMFKLKKVLDSRNYPSLKVDATVVQGARHSSVKPESFMRGMRYVFAPDTLQLASELLAPVVGKYKLDIPEPEEIILSITQEGNQLFAESQWDWGKIELFAESETTFFFEQFNGRIMIERNGDEAIKELKIDLGSVLTARRIEE